MQHWPAARNGRRSRPSAPRRLALEMLECRRLLSGVTLITHGFNSNVDGWVTAMADAIIARPDLNIDQPRYRIEVTDPGHDGGDLSVINTAFSGPDPATAADPEIVLLVDWSDVAGTLQLFGGSYTRSTVDVAAAVAEKLVSENFLGNWSRSLAELPFHLLGHSRGASLVGELAMQLGTRGIWVDQVTTFDPHPVDGVREPWLFSRDFGDAPMTAWENVAFWDNYWRTEGYSALDFTGEAVPGSHDVQLVESVLTNGGYSYEHSDVHLWYYGTIDTSTSPPANNGDEDVPNTWYGTPHPERDQSGYYFSRAVGGSRPASGIPSALGGTAARTPVNLAQATWSNLLELEVDSGQTTFSPGDAVPLAFSYQVNGGRADIAFQLDVDRNPYNGNELAPTSESIGPIGAEPVAETASLGTAGAAPGVYHVMARITGLGGQTRYAYANSPVLLEDSTPPVDDPPTVAITSPVDGAEVSGTVTVSADASDDHGVTQVEFFVGGVSLGVDSNSADGWSLAWDTTSASNGPAVVSAVVTDTAGQTADDWVNVTVANTVGATEVHIGSLSATTEVLKNGRWRAAVTVLVEDGAGGLVAGATVAGAFDGSSASGVTDADGQVTLTSGWFSKRTPSALFEVTDVSGEGLLYNSAANEITTIVVSPGEAPARRLAASATGSSEAASFEAYAAFSVASLDGETGRAASRRTAIDPAIVDLFFFVLGR